MDVKAVALAAPFLVETQPWDGERLPHGRRSLPVATALVGNGHVVDCLDVGCRAQVLNRGDESFGPRIQEMFGLWPVLGSAPLLGLEILLRCEASRLGK